MVVVLVVFFMLFNIPVWAPVTLFNVMRSRCLILFAVSASFFPFVGNGFGSIRVQQSAPLDMFGIPLVSVFESPADRRAPDYFLSPSEPRKKPSYFP